VRRIAALLREGAGDFYVRQRAIDILFDRKVRPRDFLGEIKALFEWVQENIRYVKDPVRIELLHTARRLLELRAGDCDDMTIILGALLECVGRPVRLVLTGRDGSRPRSFSHIFLEVHVLSRWIPLDPTVPYPMGWSGRAPTRATVRLASVSA
jgi:transglutaminase-like putative cysteine protease